MVSVDSVKVPRDSTYSGYPSEATQISFTGLSPSVVWLSSLLLLFGNFVTPCERPYNPKRKILLVWALPLSLAATYGIDFSFFSYRYLDVSVPCVADIHL